MMKWNRTRSLALAMAALLAGPMVGYGAVTMCPISPPTPESYTWNFPREITGLLHQMDARVADISKEAAVLEQMSYNPQIDWEAHAIKLSRLKAEVNSMGQTMCRLQMIRREALPWQQRAIDRIRPNLDMLANNLDHAIEYVGDHPETLYSSSYKEYVSNLYDRSTRIDNAIEVALAQRNANQQAESRVKAS